jgi:branched-chain amino acid transport system permease protein
VTQVIISGLQVGSTYALMALALVLVLKATDVPNFAMAEMGLLPAFIVYVLVNEQHVNYYLAILVGLVCGAVLAMVVERVFIRPIIRTSHFAIVFMTIGIFFVLNSIVALKWDSNPRSIDAPASGTWTVGSTVISQQAVLAIVVGVVIVIGMTLFFRSPAGVQMRAVAEDRVTPRLLGVRLPRVFRIAWALAGAVSAIAVVLAAQGSVLNDQTGQSLILTGFVAATLGGFSSILGAFIGGLALGVVENLAGAYISTSAASAVSLLVVVLVLMARPEGIFGQARVREV